MFVPSSPRTSIRFGSPYTGLRQDTRGASTEYAILLAGIVLVGSGFVIGEAFVADLVGDISAGAAARSATAAITLTANATPDGAESTDAEVVSEGNAASAPTEVLADALRKVINGEADISIFEDLIDDPSLLAILPTVLEILQGNPELAQVAVDFLESGDIDLNDPRVADSLPDLLELASDNPDLLNSLESLTEKFKTDPALAEQLEAALRGDISTGEALELLADEDVETIVREVAEEGDLAQEVFDDELAAVLDAPVGMDAAVAAAKASEGDVLGAAGAAAKSAGNVFSRFFGWVGDKLGGLWSGVKNFFGGLFGGGDDAGKKRIASVGNKTTGADGSPAGEVVSYPIDMPAIFMFQAGFAQVNIFNRALLAPQAATDQPALQ